MQKTIYKHKTEELALPYKKQGPKNKQHAKLIITLL